MSVTVPAEPVTLKACPSAGNPWLSQLLFGLESLQQTMACRDHIRAGFVHALRRWDRDPYRLADAFQLGVQFHKPLLGRGWRQAQGSCHIAHVAVISLHLL
jgi:hypothetical protein